VFAASLAELQADLQHLKAAASGAAAHEKNPG